MTEQDQKDLLTLINREALAAQARYDAQDRRSKSEAQQKVIQATTAILKRGQG